jgi:hypothetical protein
MPDAEVHLHLDHVLMRIDAEVQAGMAAIANQIVGYAVARVTENDQVDTGFMRAAIYAVTNKGSGMAAAESAAKALADREVVDEVMASDDAAMVVAGANYSIYQEVLRPFLFTACMDMAAALPGSTEVERVFREENHD